MVHLAFNVVQTSETCHEREELRWSEKGRGRFGLRYDADVGLEVLWIGHRIDAEHFDAAYARTKLTGEEFDERRFSSAVGTEDAEEFAFVNPDVERVKSDEIPVPLPNVLGVHEELTVGHSTPAVADPYERT